MLCRIGLPFCSFQFFRRPVNGFGVIIRPPFEDPFRVTDVCVRTTTWSLGSNFISVLCFFRRWFLFEEPRDRGCRVESFFNCIFCGSFPFLIYLSVSVPVASGIGPYVFFARFERDFFCSLEFAACRVGDLFSVGLDCGFRPRLAAKGFAHVFGAFLFRDRLYTNSVTVPCIPVSGSSYLVYDVWGFLDVCNCWCTLVVICGERRELFKVRQVCFSSIWEGFVRLY